MSPQHSFVAFSCSLLLILCLTVDASPKSVEEFNEWLKKDGHFPSELLEVSLSANGQRGLGVFAKQQLKVLGDAVQWEYTHCQFGDAERIKYSSYSGGQMDLGEGPSRGA